MWDKERRFSGPSLGSSLPNDQLDRLMGLARQVAPSYNAGEIYQHRFEAALIELREEHRISAWVRSEQNSDTDSRGIDYFVSDKCGKVPFQITSHPEAGNIHIRERKLRKTREQGIQWVFIKRKDRIGMKEVEQIKNEILNRILDYRELFPQCSEDPDSLNSF